MAGALFSTGRGLEYPTSTARSTARRIPNAHRHVHHAIAVLTPCVPRLRFATGQSHKHERTGNPYGVGVNVGVISRHGFMVSWTRLPNGVPVSRRSVKNSRCVWFNAG
ncbi:unnamed protein product [Gadus morhua 'NCC']